MGAIDSNLFRAVMGRFATGVTVVTWTVDGCPAGMTANAFMSVSMNPPLALISVRNASRFNQHMGLGQRYGVSILRDSQAEISAHFGGKPDPELHIDFADHAGTPVVQGCLASFVCRVVDIHPAGDHALYIGEIEQMDHGQDASPLIFYGGRYEQIR